MDFNEYQERIKDTWISNKRDFIRIVLGICGESGEIAEKIKKHYRDGNTNIREDIKKELGDLLYYITQCANYLQLNLEEVAKSNLSKLESRKKRNRIQGNADNR